MYRKESSGSLSKIKFPNNKKYVIIQLWWQNFSEKGKYCLFLLVYVGLVE